MLHSDIYIAALEAGVGSILGLNNAEVASLLGLDVLLVANGGLGSTFDLLNLNRTLFRSKGVNVRFVLLNKVGPEATCSHEHVLVLTARAYDGGLYSSALGRECTMHE